MVSVVLVLVLTCKVILWFFRNRRISSLCRVSVSSIMELNFYRIRSILRLYKSSVSLRVMYERIRVAFGFEPGIANKKRRVAVRQNINFQTLTPRRVVVFNFGIFTTLQISLTPHIVFKL